MKTALEWILIVTLGATLGLAAELLPQYVQPTPLTYDETLTPPLDSPTLHPITSMGEVRGGIPPSPLSPHETPLPCSRKDHSMALSLEDRVKALEVETEDQLRRITEIEAKIAHQVIPTLLDLQNDVNALQASVTALTAWIVSHETGHP